MVRTATCNHPNLINHINIGKDFYMINAFSYLVLSDEVIVCGASSSQRVLPSSFVVNNSNGGVANGIDAQGRLNPENRPMDSDERAVYNEALQVLYFWSV